jgi:hypothetical protein
LSCFLLGIQRPFALSEEKLFHFSSSFLISSEIKQKKCVGRGGGGNFFTNNFTPKNIWIKNEIIRKRKRNSSEGKMISKDFSGIRAFSRRFF